MKRFHKNSCAAAILASIVLLIAPFNASAFLSGTVLLTPNSSVLPGDATGSDPGTLLASLSAPFTTNPPFTSGTLITAVYRESDGFLDFYYQIVNSATSIDGIARETDSSFAGFATSVGFRTDGSTLPGGVFSDGTVAPASVDRGASGDSVGFNFPLSGGQEVGPGQTSFVFVISTDATNFTEGNMSVIDGGVFTTAAFQPAVPEPATIALLICGALIAAMVRLRNQRRV